MLECRLDMHIMWSPCSKLRLVTQYKIFFFFAACYNKRVSVSIRLSLAIKKTQYNNGLRSPGSVLVISLSPFLSLPGLGNSEMSNSTCLLGAAKYIAIDMLVLRTHLNMPGKLNTWSLPYSRSHEPSLWVGLRTLCMPSHISTWRHPY